MFRLTLVVVTVLLVICHHVYYVNAACNLLCDVGKSCFATSTDAMDCLASIPLNKVWANATLDVLMQSLENYGFKDLYHSTGPPYSISLDVQGELAATVDMVNNDEFANDLDFQEHVQNILQKTIDAHTRYQKPYCYDATFIQPFSFEMKIVPDPNNAVESEPRLFTMRNSYTDQYKTTLPDYAATVDAILDKEILLLNGVEFTAEISSWGDAHETRSNNRGARFNAAFRSYLYRSAVSVVTGQIEDLKVTLADGTEYTLPWMAMYTSKLADPAVCAKQATTDSVKEEQSLSPINRIPIHHELVYTLHPERLTDTRSDRQVIIPSNDTYFVSCFIQTMESTTVTKKAKINRVLVMKIASFAPPGESTFLEHAATCLSTEYDLVVVDVMQNGGGEVCLGLRMLELLIEDYAKDHTKVQMHYDLPHSDLMDKYIEVVNSPSPFPGDDGDIIDLTTHKPFADGRAYYYPGRNVTQGGKVSWRTNYFALDCSAIEALPTPNFKPSRYMPKEKLIILTDGTCGSTCASFTKIPQEAEKATFVGAGGLWHENMDVSSFAGGFVSNADVMFQIANLSGLTFPTFLTNQRWQFDWAVWYSQKLPSRPTQFTEQTPEYREAFWGFPHVSIPSTATTAMVSSLYDSVINNAIDRVAATNDATANSSDDDDSCYLDDNQAISLMVVAIVLGVILCMAT